MQEETVEEKSSGGTNPLSVSLYQMDLDRTLFLLRSYLRIRIQKVPNLEIPLLCLCLLSLNSFFRYEIAIAVCFLTLLVIMNKWVPRFLKAVGNRDFGGKVKVFENHGFLP